MTIKYSELVKVLLDSRKEIFDECGKWVDIMYNYTTCLSGIIKDFGANVSCASWSNVDDLANAIKIMTKVQQILESLNSKYAGCKIDFAQ